MPRRDDIESILIIGSGPIVIGQACEFDYSGTQACKVLRALGYRVVLVNSNPATIMTDPEFADATYLEPLTVDSLRSVIEKERPDALLPTLGGQTALNLAVALGDAGVLDECGVELIGAGLDAIRTAEDRALFRAAMEDIGLTVPRSGFAYTIEEALRVIEDVGYPAIVRPSFVLGGGGTGIARNRQEFIAIAADGLATSPVSEILVEVSVEGWKEYELEVMRDLADNVVIVCSIENLDPMGIHTGDSITVAPALTLTDVEYQRMRDAAIACIRRIGVGTGGSNIQFAVNPSDGEMLVIEMNPRVSRSSALASKATGFPIAKIAAQLAVGLTLDEIPNDITKKTPASFEPAIDYVVVKVPRFAFEKFPEVPTCLGTKMQSVGEAMAIGRSFPEALQKALRSLETGRAGLGADPAEAAITETPTDRLSERVAAPSPDRIFEVAELLRRGIAVEVVARATCIDPWFLDEIAYVVDVRRRLEAGEPCEAEARRAGFCDTQIEHLTGRPPAPAHRVFKTVDTCAAEFEAATPYFYSTFEDEDEARPGERPTVVILGSGPNRIGQGIEFDCCCVHAAFALGDAGYDTVMVNCNPETVSTDYDTSTRLYFEPLTLEDVIGVVDAEKPEAVIVQLGGQTPLKLAGALAAQGVRVAGTSPESIDVAEDRERFGALARSLGIPQPDGGTATTVDGALDVADRVGFPVLVRPSYVLGGRAMQIVYGPDELRSYMVGALTASRRRDEGGVNEARPVLIDRFLEDAIEVDVDALFDGEEILLGGVMQHIEEAGVHSGDSACVLPPIDLSPLALDTIEAHTEALAKALEVRGLINIQFAVSRSGGEVYVLEANPRASRTVPFVSKATGVPLARAAARIMMGSTIAELRKEGLLRPPATGHVAVKEAVLPFTRFPGSDSLLGPEMRSTGEVMGIASSFGLAFAKSQAAAGMALPLSGSVFISVSDRDKPGALAVARRFAQMGFRLLATEGTATYLRERGLDAEIVGKLSEDGRPTVVDLIREGSVGLVLNTPRGQGPRADGAYIRLAATETGIPCITTLAGAWAAAVGIAALRRGSEAPQSLQEWHRGPSQMTL